MCVCLSGKQYSTPGLPQSHCSPSSSRPLPHSATPTTSDGEGWFFRQVPPPRTIRFSKSCPLQLLKVETPLQDGRIKMNGYVQLDRPEKSWTFELWLFFVIFYFSIPTWLKKWKHEKDHIEFINWVYMQLQVFFTQQLHPWCIYWSHCSCIRHGHASCQDYGPSHGPPQRRPKAGCSHWTGKNTHSVPTIIIVNISKYTTLKYKCKSINTYINIHSEKEHFVWLILRF